MANLLHNVAAALEQVRLLTTNLEELRQGIQDSTRNAQSTTTTITTTLTPQTQQQQASDSRGSSRNSSPAVDLTQEQAQPQPQSQDQQQQQQQQQSLELTSDQARRIKDSFSCTICVDYFESPYTLQCGHTFCKVCIRAWFGQQKSCPGCRRDIATRPVPAYTVETQVNAIRALIPSTGLQAPSEGSTSVEERGRAVQEFEQFLDRLFPARTSRGYIRDEEDGVDRCPSCAWELDEDGICVNCNLEFRQAARQNRVSFTSNSDSLSSSSDEDDDGGSDEDETMGGFIVSEADDDDDTSNSSSSNNSSDSSGSEDDVSDSDISMTDR
ncbi:hypothetical protein BDB00DRAFT_219905 [Zychaea mexicana]|uniref:uncharacterized protein n=1 Tax=Zychaea mexicana TaxID=64656 RepID=UPI0022FDE5AB|nr:uncharacterized protein BDB00DRAFT_219905 [Zychaea mexicana]KAI9499131.1 hypothetical protein BDB00DRAFT_219905 [Zychaea mexicana]